MAEAPSTELRQPVSQISVVPHIFVFVVIWALTQAFKVLLQNPDVLQGAQTDTDGYMRLVRVRQLLEGGAWFDGSVSRSNWPFGESHHWTRPLDVLILGLYWPLRLGMESDTALAVAGALISPACHLATCLAAPWVIRPVVPGPERLFAMPAMLIQPGLLAYGNIGRADHHALILLIFVLVLGTWIRTLLDPSDRRAPVTTGILAGLGIWVSPEALLPLGIIFVSGAALWMLRANGIVVANLRLCAALLGTVAAGVVVERPPTQWSTVAFDQISIAHVTVSALALLFWAVIAVRRTAWDRPGMRAAVVFAGAIASFGIIAWQYPGFFRGPWHGVDLDVIQIWLSHVSELQPLFPRGTSGLGFYVAQLGPAILLIPAAIYWLHRDRNERMAHVWFLMLISLCIYVPLASAQLRFSGHAGALLALLVVELLRRALGQVRRVRKGARQSAARIAAIASLMTGFFMLGAAIEASIGPNETGPTSGQSVANCALTGITPVLANPETFGSEARTILAFIDFGPELLYRTPHRVLAGPYHRNYQGIMDAYRIMTAVDLPAAQSLITHRKIDLILICPSLDRYYFDRNEASTLYRLLAEGTPPAWITAIDLPSSVPSGFRLFEVRDSSAVAL